jgi:thymidylate kinase
VSDSPCSTTDPAFFVLLGPDYAGKSSAMRELANSLPEWRFISIDRAFVEPAHKLIAKLRRQLITEALPALGPAYSPDFAAALMQTAVVHLRDQVVARDPGRPALVDSYYYKILAKCLLVGAAPSMLSWWRSFPQPRRIIYLDVSPEVAWRRSGFGTAANRLEHYGDLPGRTAFETFQADLHKLMYEEIRQLPVSHINSQNSVAETARAIREVLSNEYP